MRKKMDFRKGLIRVVSAYWLLGSVFLLGGLAYIVLFPHAQIPAFDSQTMLSDLKAAYKSHIPDSFHPYVRFFYHHINLSYMNVAVKILTNPVFYLLIVSVFILEWLIPAKKGQPIFSLGLYQDFCWLLIDSIILQVIFVAIFAGLLKYIYDKHLSFLTIKAVETWPLVVRGIMSLLLFDFLSWLHHFVKHKVRYFWLFHAVHHSQREVNLFTDLRVHLGERLIAITLIFIPMFMFQVKIPSDFYIAFIIPLYTMVYHANLRTNYGFLKYIMITPQSHRIHHSVKERHRDKNFGLIFSIWDRMFGTLYNNYDEYDYDTGIDDEHFPIEKSVKGLSVFRNWLAQFIYPFRQILEMGRKERI